MDKIYLHAKKTLLYIYMFVWQTKLEKNWKFLVEFYATFAPLGVPSLSRWKARTRI